MLKDPYSLSSYQFDLPPHLIAQYPCVPRDHSRVLIVDRATGNLSEMRFYELADLLQEGDSLVFNDTRVIPARLLGKREHGGEAEIFLLKRRSLDTWEAIGRPGKKLKVGSQVTFGEGFSCVVTEVLEGGGRVVRFNWKRTFEEALEQYGKLPLPPYIRQGTQELGDAECYQTVYAKHSGAVAAPTAGLHFTDSLLKRLSDKNIEQIKVTLHVGLGTFKPVQEEDIRLHPMHSEKFIISPEAADQLNQRSVTGKQICVGTTCCRALESACQKSSIIQAGEYDTNIFIYPGYQFKYVQSMLTNFHLPGSTLLMLVSAFAGYDLMKEAYAKAIKENFRFYSYGDAMLIL